MPSQITPRMRQVLGRLEEGSRLVHVGEKHRTYWYFEPDHERVDDASTVTGLRNHRLIALHADGSWGLPGEGEGTPLHVEQGRLMERARKLTDVEAEMRALRASGGGYAENEEGAALLLVDALLCLGRNSSAMWTTRMVARIVDDWFAVTGHDRSLHADMLDSVLGDRI